MFWIVAFTLAAAVAATITVPLVRGGRARAEPGTEAVSGAQAGSIYRDQLKQVESDLERGTLAPDEAERARTEIARRLLAADQQAQAAASPGAAPQLTNRLAIAGVAALVVVGALGLYSQLGVAGYPDVPRAQRIANSEWMRATRMSQTEAEELATEARGPVDESQLSPETRALIGQLRDIVPSRPDDLRGWQLLVDYETQLDNFVAAARAQEQVIAIKGRDATVADRIALADRLVSAAGGFVSPTSETLVRAVLEEDEGNIAARYYLGLLYYQTDRPDVAFRFWRDLVEQGDIENPHVRLARAGVEDAAFRAGLTYSQPEPTGPSLADAEALAQLSAQDRAAAIEGMVERLADRLAREGGPVEDWARLINAYAVLGEGDQAMAILREARGVFGASDDAAALLDRVAEEAGLE